MGATELWPMIAALRAIGVADAGALDADALLAAHADVSALRGEAGCQPHVSVGLTLRADAPL